MASTTLTPHGHRTGGGRTGQNTALRMSTSTKIIVGIVIVVVMALTSFWGVYAPSFSEAYILPVQMTAADGTPLGDFQCRPVPGENGKTLLVFRDADFLRQTTGGMVHSKIILSYKGTPFFEGIVPGPMEAIEIPSGSLPPPSGNSGITEAPGRRPVMALLLKGRRFLYTTGEILWFYRIKR